MLGKAKGKVKPKEQGKERRVGNPSFKSLPTSSPPLVRTWALPLTSPNDKCQSFMRLWSPIMGRISLLRERGDDSNPSRNPLRAHLLMLRLGTLSSCLEQVRSRSRTPFWKTPRSRYWRRLPTSCPKLLACPRT
jgi:hypothetical protein